MDERDARISAQLADLWRKDDPEAATKAANEAMTRQWGIVKDPNASDASRVSAMEEMQALSEKFPHLKGIAPRSMPKFEGSPWVRQNLQLGQLRLLQTLRSYDNDEEKRKLEVENARKRLSLMDKQALKVDADLRRMAKEETGQFADVDLANSIKLRDEHTRAMKEFDYWRGLAADKRPLDWEGRLAALGGKVSAAEKARSDFLYNHRQTVIPPSGAPTTRPAMQGTASKRQRGTLNKFGFDDFDMQTIKALQASGLSYEAAANRVRSDNGGR
jgi:hypothetical protein